LSFSVVVTNHNRADTLPIAINSILNQKGIDKLEIIIVDDASTDNSLEIIKEFKKAYPSVVRAFETHESLTRNICLPANIGFKRAKYEYVVLNPSDIVQLFNTNFLEYAKILKGKPNAWVDPVLIDLPNLRVKKYSQAGGCVKREYLRQIKGFDERMKGWGSNEPDLFYRLSLVGVEIVRCTTAVVLHFRCKVCGNYEHYKVNPENAKIHHNNAKKGIIAPNDTWGEHPKLEEVL